MKKLQITSAKSVCIIALLSLSLYAFALDQDVQVDILTTKIKTALKADKHADALPYFLQLEEMESSLKKPLPESFHFQYIKSLSVTGDKDKALNKSEAYLSKYGKKGKYYSQVLEIISPLQIEKDKAVNAIVEAEKQKQIERDKVIENIKMVQIPRGVFVMGNDQSEWDDKPSHKVTVDYDFEISQFEVTQAQWQALMGSNPSYFKDCGQNCPVAQLSWNDVQIFIQKLNQLTGKQYRLPTEAEWEYTCRAGTGNQYRFCGGNDPSQIAWHAGNSSNTKPVGQRLPNAWGIYDMDGNVTEWVQDHYHKYQSAPKSAQQAVELEDKDGMRMRVARGASYQSDFNTIFVPYDLAKRNGGHPSNRFKHYGFRLARTIP